MPEAKERLIPEDSSWRLKAQVQENGSFAIKSSPQE
jgi:hypothetical protein